MIGLPTPHTHTSRTSFLTHGMHMAVNQSPLWKPAVPPALLGCVELKKEKKKERKESAWNHVGFLGKMSALTPTVLWPQLVSWSSGSQSAVLFWGSGYLWKAYCSLAAEQTSLDLWEELPPFRSPCPCSWRCCLSVCQCLADSVSCRRTRAVGCRRSCRPEQQLLGLAPRQERGCLSSGHSS